MDIRQKKNFFYSQNSIKNFLECPKKFKYRYLEGISWKNSDELIKQSLKDGEDFHILAERYFLGMDEDFYYKDINKLSKWMMDLKKNFPKNKNNSYLGEYEIRQKKNGINLMARYDLISFKSTGEIEIYDWKTNKDKFHPNFGSNSLQTKIYLFLLTENLNLFSINYFKFKNISMTYWQTNFPDSPLRISYSSQMHEENKIYLKNLIKEINSYDFSKFEQSDKKACKFCEFMSICKNK